MSDDTKNPITGADYTTQSGTVFNYMKPKPNKWKIRLFGKRSATLQWFIPDDVNWFHRLMTKLLFGWYWEKLD